MRKSAILLSVITLLLSGCLQSSNKKQTVNNSNTEDTTLTNYRQSENPNFNSNENKAIETIREFYTLYLTEMEKISDFDPKAVTAIKNKYQTKELRKKLEEAGLEYCPFVNAQEWYVSWLETLEITLENSQEGAYKVCFQYLPDNIKCITLYLVENDGRYLINDIDEFRNE